LGGETVSERGQTEPAAAGIRVEEALSRGDVLLKGALAAGALYGLGAVGPYVRRALADGGGDAEVLNYLLPFEYLQVSLYNRASTEVNDKGEKMPLQSREKQLITQLLGQEAEHVKALQEMIEDMGGEPVKKGEYAFAFRIFAQVLGIAGRIETAAVGAFNGAITRLESDEARELAYSILQTDARHAATVLAADSEEPTLYTFDHCVPETGSILQVVQYTGVYPEFDNPVTGGDGG
jgi:rubrerythrin